VIGRRERPMSATSSIYQPVSLLPTEERVILPGELDGAFACRDPEQANRESSRRRTRSCPYSV